MRFRLPLGRGLFFLCAFLFALVALLPLRLALDWLALDERGLAAREARGSIWLGVLREAQLGPVPIGDVTARLQSLPLFIGRARVDIAAVEGGEGSLKGGLTVSRHGFGIDDVTGSLRAGSVAAPLPLGSLNLTDVSARFADGQCAAAAGQVRASLTSAIAGVALPSGLSGNARCDGGALLLPLLSQSGLEALNLRLQADGRYTIELAVRPTDETLRARLAAAGFVPAGPGYALTAAGRF